jgi:hypothetical protein
MQGERSRANATVRRRKLRAAKARFADRLIAAYAMEREARKAIQEAEVAEGLRKNADMYTGVLVEWDWETTGSGYWRRRTGQKKLTGRRGRYEICTPQTIVQHRHHLPEMGGRFIRLLKKDGSPALQAVRYYGSEEWLPEGQKPEPSQDDAA